MRTKRILSILLAAIMAVGAFGIVSVYAEEQETALGPGAQGWAGVVNIAEDISAAGGVDSAVIVWEAFLGSANKLPTDPDSFITLYSKTVKEADVQWDAWRVLNDGDLSTTEPIDVKPERAQAINTSGSYLEITNAADRTDVKLCITQVAGKERYSWVRVQLTVTYPGGSPSIATSSPIWVQLRDPGPLARKLLEANKELAKTDRYTSAYLDNLRVVTRGAESVVNKKITQAELDAWLDSLNKALDGKKADGTSVGKKWKVNTWGWDWWDNLFSDGFCKVWWSIKDAFKPIIDFVGQIGRALGFFMNLFGGLGGLFK